MRGRYLADRLEWSTTVPPELVHHRGGGEVLLTSVSHAGQNGFLLAVRWPLLSSLYGVDRFGCHDAMLIPETLRQAGTAVAHAGYGVPFDHQFIMVDMNFCVVDRRLLAVVGGPTDLVARVTCTDVRHKQDRFKSAVVGLSLERDGSVLAEGSATLVCVRREIYQKLRGRPALEGSGLPVEIVEKLDTGSVGRVDARDVLLCRAQDGAAPSTQATWPLRIDPSHSLMFDHWVDHVPGMVQLEAFRQAALAMVDTANPALRWCFSGCRVVFHRLVELNQPMWAHAEDVGEQVIRVELRQGDTKACSEGTILLQGPDLPCGGPGL